MSTFFTHMQYPSPRSAAVLLPGLANFSVQNMFGLEPRPKPVCDPEFMAANKNERMRCHVMSRVKVVSLCTLVMNRRSASRSWNANWPTVAKCNEFLN